MICPNCGKEVNDKNATFCPYCGLPFTREGLGDIPTGAAVDPARPIDGSGTAGEITAENFRNLPTYKPNLIKLLIFSGLAFVLFALGLVGALIYRLGKTEAETLPGIILAILGLVMGFIIFIFAMATNKKVFPQVNVKMKGVEFLIPIFIAFGLACAVGALVLFGFTIMVY